MIMCGIFGIAHYDNALPRTKSETYIELLENLMVGSQSRGRDAAGICVMNDKGVYMYKNNVPAGSLIYHKEFREVSESIHVSEETGLFKCAIGHTRAKTKGSQKFNVNNHPIVANKVVGVHNGMIANDDELFETYDKLIERVGRVDSEIIFRLIDHFVKHNNDLVSAVRHTNKELWGSYSCAFIHLDYPNYLTLFRESYQPLAIYIFNNINTIVFASTTHIIERAIETLTTRFRGAFSHPQIIEVERSSGYRINLTNGKIFSFGLESVII